MLDRLIGERYRRHRYRVGYRDGLAEARQAVAEARQEAQQAVAEAQQEAQQAIAEARQEARREAQQRLDEWNNRRLAAQAAGEPFTEPLPSLDSPNGEDGRAAGNGPGGYAVGQPGGASPRPRKPS